MKKPRLIYYNDAHHFNAKRIEPPASIHKLQWPVDEVLGTGVDLLVLGLGYADVYFHNSKVGRVVGQMKEVWANYIDWRIMRMVEEAQKMGTDQVREAIKRGHEMGLAVFPSLKLQASSPPGSERCGLLKWNHGAEVCIGEEGRAEWCYDFAHELVRQEKLAVLREILEDYEADGIELDFMFDSYYFKQDEIEKNIPLMNRFIAEIREMANAIGNQQGREIPIMVRVDLEKEKNLLMGLDVETWLKEGSINYVVGQDPYVLYMTAICPGPSAKGNTRFCERWLILKSTHGVISVICSNRERENWTNRQLHQSVNYHWKLRREKPLLSISGLPMISKVPSKTERYANLSSPFASPSSVLRMILNSVSMARYCLGRTRKSLMNVL